MSTMVEVRGARKSFKDHVVLDGVDVDVQAGEVVVVLGPSGSGKSTLLRIINGLETIDEGTISVDGKPVSSSHGRHLVRAEVGMVFQNFHLFPHMTVLRNLTLAPGLVKGMDRKKAEETAQALLNRVGIQEQAAKYPAQLSGGQQQRVAIARSLMMSPKVMLFDEPTSALDPAMRGEVLEVMKGLAKEGMTMMIVTHEINFARDVADRILFVDQGKILEACAPEEFFQRPRTDQARNYLRRL